ncbi:TetR/AcrR family transcriptional regulator [Actinokineospora auranticolor]|uniref:Regulatory TetR family protein n=1 Tax=Actinokineospora auranticolor TaxID=155976 RepID=A0A2S6GYT5_9PSEU|nr:TetR/AcrR family transcriptional regulator [Actinokineospora auranticolor]PPK70368.1 regulatory TetR family protein [Actinokineospora auranticolor]
MDGRLARGEETRRATLARAVDIATVDGLEGLTVGRLAGELGFSKSGVFAHFGSKEELQLATVEFATQVFIDQVVRPGLRAPRGVPRLMALFELWMRFSRERVFPGGCFFSAVSAEFDARDGRVRDLVVARNRQWAGLLVAVAADAVADGQLPADTDVDQLVFEVNALGRAANEESLTTRDDTPYTRAETGVRHRLGV